MAQVAALDAVYHLCNTNEVATAHYRRESRLVYKQLACNVNLRLAHRRRDVTSAFGKMPQLSWPKNLKPSEGPEASPETWQADGKIGSDRDRRYMAPRRCW